MVALDPGRGVRTALDHVGVQRPLHEEAGAPVLARDLLEHADELLADPPALLLRIGHAVETSEEPVLRLHVDERDPEVPPERLFDLLGLALAQQSGVDEHARQLLADRLVHEQRRHGRVHPAGERAEHLGLSDLGSDRGDRALDHVGRGPVREQAAPVVEEPLHHGGPLRCVRDLGVELHRVQGPLGILHRGDRDRVGAGRDAESVGRPRDRIAVAHPDLLVGRKVLEQDPRLGHVELGAAVLPLPRRPDLAPERLRHQLVPVADPEHRDAQLEHAGIQGRRPGLVHRRGATREHDARGRARGELGGREVVRHDLGVHVALADPASDQLRVLRPEIDDQDRAPGGGHAASDPSRRAGPSGTSCPRS